jgi:hypothetical protein
MVLQSVLSVATPSQEITVVMQQEWKSSPIRASQRKSG